MVQTDLHRSTAAREPSPSLRMSCSAPTRHFDGIVVAAWTNRHPFCWEFRPRSSSLSSVSRESRKAAE